MIRYAIDEGSKFDLKQLGKHISIVTKAPITIGSCTNTGIYFWPDDGTVLLVINKCNNFVDAIFDKQELIIDTSGWSQPIIRPGTQIAIVMPIATAYFGHIELEQIRPEWFYSTVF